MIYWKQARPFVLPWRDVVLCGSIVALVLVAILHATGAHGLQPDSATSWGAQAFPESVIVIGLPPAVAQMVRRGFVGCVETRGTSQASLTSRASTITCSRLVERMRSLPGIRSLVTRTSTAGGREYRQVLAQHGTVVRGYFEPRTLSVRQWEPGVRLRIDSALQIGERLLGRTWRSRGPNDPILEKATTTKNTGPHETRPSTAEIALLLPILYRGIESVAVQVSDPMSDAGPRSLVATRLTSAHCSHVNVLALFLDVGNGVRAGSVLARSGLHREIKFGIQFDENGQAGVRSYLAGRRGRNMTSLEVAASGAESSLAPPASRSLWISEDIEQDRTPVSFTRAEYERKLFDGTSLQIFWRTEFIWTGRRGYFVPVLASAWNIFGQRFTAEAAVQNEAVLTLRWNAWPGGSYDLHRVDRLLADMSALTGAGKSGSVHRW